jgi:hypothetical protein
VDYDAGEHATNETPTTDGSMAIAIVAITAHKKAKA